MKPAKDGKKTLDRNRKYEYDQEPNFKKKEKFESDDYQESLQEDMRGPLEGMEAVPPKK